MFVFEKRKMIALKPVMYILYVRLFKAFKCVLCRTHRKFTSLKDRMYVDSTTNGVRLYFTENKCQLVNSSICDKQEIFWNRLHFVVKSLSWYVCNQLQISHDEKSTIITLYFHLKQILSSHSVLGNSYKPKNTTENSLFFYRNINWIFSRHKRTHNTHSFSFDFFYTWLVKV